MKKSTNSKGKKKQFFLATKRKLAADVLHLTDLAASCSIFVDLGS